MKAKLKNIDLEALPKYDCGQYNGKINWQHSVGCILEFNYGDISGVVEIVQHIKQEETLYIQYLDCELFKIKIKDFKNCSFGKLLSKKTSDFKIDIGTEFQDVKRNLIILRREYRISKNNQQMKWYNYKCNRCGWNEGWIVESSLVAGRGCSCCNSSQTTVVGINSIVDTASWMIKYFQNGYEEAKQYTHNSGKKINPVCPDCHQVKDKEITIRSIYKNKSIGCNCGDGQSYPNKLMFSILKSINIVFETEYSPNWIKPKRYDFYFEIDNKKYIIEMDGGWHKTDNNLNGQTLECSQNLDTYKDLLAQDNNIQIIRIDSSDSNLDYIKSHILSSCLINLVDLSQVDWNQCEEFALSNLVKFACELKYNNPILTTTQIGEIMNLHPSTIVSYLKRGSKIGWCTYDIKEERRKIGANISNNLRKPVEMFKDNISLGIFPSINELERQSEVLCGIKLYQSCISRVCDNKSKHHKGFTFKYI